MKMNRIAGEDDATFAYRVFDDAGQEVGEVILHAEPGDAVLHIEKLYLRREHRRRGLGRRVVAMIEQLARELGRRRITLWAEPYDDDDLDLKEQLIAWWRERGYRVTPRTWDELEKLL
jgi:GNAT superfamily N-acetyltransferase